MNISKTLFKNLTRCSNFPALYNMYINRTAHDVKEIDGYEIKKLIDDVTGLESNIFNEIDEKSRDIFGHMFDEETGEDLTNVTSAQLEAFADTYVEVERLAMEQARRIFGKDLIASTNTYEQKSFSFTDNDNTYYCYLDGYLEEENDIYIFEVKASTSRKYDVLDMAGKTKNNDDVSFPLFVKNNKGIMEFVGYNYVGLPKGKRLLTKEDVDTKISSFYDINHDNGKYIYDLSVERFIVENSIDNHDKKIHYYLVLLNAEYVFDGIYVDGVPSYERSINGQELFKIYDMTEDEIYQYILRQENPQYYAEMILHYLYRHHLNQINPIIKKFINVPVNGETSKIIGTALRYLMNFKNEETEKICLEFVIGDNEYLADIAKDYWADEE